MYVKTYYTIPVYTTVFLKMNPQVQSMKKISKIKNIRILI